MRSLDSLNNAVGALHRWRSNMSLDDLSEQEIDHRLVATCLYSCMLVDNFW